ncbi:hypothetical protein CDL15_Pgr021199 [Punica granatum]|uniref:Uncharacterized protein n=1 Tax=Punica granatum TaxID=22663 RepID=A0A218WKC3_PUNGR|nr:hypothetical protein CDL15_Pgr021199 [Punica granatum]
MSFIAVREPNRGLPKFAMGLGRGKCHLECRGSKRSDGCDGWVMGGDRCEGNLNCVVEGDLSRRPWGEATADCGRAELGGVEPWLGVEPRLDGLAWLSCGSHSIKRKAGKRLRLDWTRIRSPMSN